MRTTYKDFSLNMLPHPNTGDVSSVNDEQSISQSIKSLVLTNSYERLFQPNIGGNANAILFENWSETVEADLVNRIKTTLKNHEPRANVLSVKTIQTQSNSVDVTIVYRSQTSVQDAKVNIVLERIF